MRTTGVVVEAGRGVLGGAGYPEYEVRVADTVTSLSTRDGSVTETTSAYEILWWPVRDSDVPIGDRPVAKLFESAEEREAFLAANVRSQVALAPAHDAFERSHPLAEIVGERLAGVRFGPSHLQLDFEPTGAVPVPEHRGPMTFDVPPHLLDGGRTLPHGAPGYADGLVALVGRTVTEADEYLDLGIFLGFDDGTALARPLHDVDACEVATFNTRSGFSVWTSR